MKFKNLQLTFPSVMLSALLILNACGGMKKAAKNVEDASFKTEPEVLEVHGDSVAYEVTFTTKKFHKKAALKIDPVLKYGSDTSQRPPVTIKGEKSKTDADLVIDSKDGSVTFKDKFAYDPAMEKSTLVAKNSLIIEGSEKELDQCLDLPERKLAEGIIATSQKVAATEDILISVDEYKVEDKSVRIDLYYLINVGSFNPSFSDKNAGIDNKKQLDSIKNLVDARRNEIKGITINSYASPDGELARNQQLSKDRSNSTFTYLKKDLNKKGFKEVNDSSFYMSHALNEDWAGWKQLVTASNLSDKNQILSIMNSGISDEEKEARIKREHAASFESMKKDMLPKLRRSVVIFHTTPPIKTNEELVVAGKQSLDNLSQMELIQLGKITEDPTEKKRIYNSYIQKYANDWRGYNNLAVIQLGEGDLAGAEPNLKKANELSPSNPIVLNNMGVAARMNKDYKKAEEYYNAAKSANDKNVDVSYNLGVLRIKQGKYKDAIAAFNGKTCDYNVGLAYLLDRDYKNAESNLNCIPVEKKTGDVYYLLAVLGARTNNKEMITTNLRMAIQKDAKYRNMAKSDGEFIKFRDSQEFNNAIR